MLRRNGPSRGKNENSAFSSLLASGLQSKRNKKINCTDIILSFNDMFDVSAVLLQNTFETTSSLTDA